MKRELLHVIARWALITASLSVLLFLAAGTTHVPSIRRYLVVFSALLLATMLAVDPQLAKERAHPSNAGIGDGSRFTGGFLFLLTITVAASSVGRFRPGFSVPDSLRDAALIAFALSGVLQGWAMVVNSFFSPLIRLQTERGHHVISGGPYRFVRHPGYLAMLIALPSSALAIGSWLALIPATCFLFTLLRRVRTEEQFLHKHLPGYSDYANRVPGALIPGQNRLFLNNTMSGRRLRNG